MTDHKGLPVAGYQPQPMAKVALVNSNKEAEERLLRLIDNLLGGEGALVIRDATDSLKNQGFEIDHKFADKRWLSIARTHFEQGFMALNRAIFQPSRVKLPEDAQA